MKAEELEKHTKEMVKYILCDDASKDAEIVESYTNTFIMIAKDFAESQIKVELPSDYKIKAYASWTLFLDGQKWDNFVQGAKWMRNKLKEQ